MVEVRLDYVTFIARDVAALAQFYVDAMGFEEVLASRDERYREVIAGTVMIGFAYQGLYTMLDMTEEADPRGTRSLVTFALDDRAAVAPAVERAIGFGAAVVKAPFDTHFGRNVAVLRDPEGNIFRLSAPAAA